MKNKIKLAAPWITFFNKIKAMFEQDPDIGIKVDDKKYKITLRVRGQKKYEALRQLLPEEKTFGNVTAYVNIVPENEAKASTSDLFNDAFKGNPAFVATFPITDFFTNPVTYVIFKKEVVQFYNDNGADPRGIESTLYQNIARDIFTDCKGALYCTDSNTLKNLKRNVPTNQATPEEIAEWEKYNGKDSFSGNNQKYEVYLAKANNEEQVETDEFPF